MKLHNSASTMTDSFSYNSLRPRPNRHPFADDIFKRIFEHENEWISPRISLKFVPKVRINHIPALVQIMAWCRPGDKPLSEPMMVSLTTHICFTRPQWDNWAIAAPQLLQSVDCIRLKIKLIKSNLFGYSDIHNFGVWGQLCACELRASSMSVVTNMRQAIIWNKDDLMPFSWI